MQFLKAHPYLGRYKVVYSPLSFFFITPFQSFPLTCTLLLVLYWRMQHDRSHSASSLAWNTQGIHAGSISSGSPIGSPLASPLHSPCDSPREQLHNQFARQVSLQPPGQQQQQPSVTTTTTGTTNTTTTPSNTKQTNNTFVHKLFK